ncbi:MAG: Trm112 family protein [Terracidiphilus sp.]
MTDESRDANPDDLKQWAEDVVCPACQAPLRFEDATVTCSGCARTYPIVDDIPVLIPQRATPPRT